MKYTSHHCCDKYRSQNGLLSPLLFSELFKIMVKNLLSEVLGGTIAPLTPTRAPLLHGLMVFYDETTEWLLNNCPEIWYCHAVIFNNWLKRR